MLKFYKIISPTEEWSDVLIFNRLYLLALSDYIPTRIEDNLCFCFKFWNGPIRIRNRLLEKYDFRNLHLLKRKEPLKYQNWSFNQCNNFSLHLIAISGKYIALKPSCFSIQKFLRWQRCVCLRLLSIFLELIHSLFFIPNFGYDKII